MFLIYIYYWERNKLLREKNISSEEAKGQENPKEKRKANDCMEK